MSVANLRQVCSALVAYKTRDSFPSQSNVDVTFIFLRNCKRKEHTVYVVSSLTSFSYLSALSQCPLCKSPSVEAVSMHRCWLLGVCVTSLSLYLCILIARTHVQWSIFFMDCCIWTRAFFFPPTLHKHFFLPLYEHSQRTSYVNPAKGCAAVLQRDKRKRKRLKRGISSALFKSSFYLGYVSFVCILSISDAFAQSICFSLPCRLVNQIIVPSVTLPHVQWKWARSWETSYPIRPLIFGLLCTPVQIDQGRVLAHPITP